MFKPRRTLRSGTIKAALKSFVVPVFANTYHICAIRALWEVNDEDIHVARLNIWKKREELQDVVKQHNAVAGFFSCITAMTASKQKACKRKRQAKQGRRQPENSDTEESSGDSTIESTVPGNVII